MVRISDNIKRSKLKMVLAHRIENGEFKYGERFPGLHQLIKEYSVSYVTVNKAVKMLAAEGYLNCRAGVGYFVCYVKSDHEAHKEVNFITSQKYMEVFREHHESGLELFRKNGWKVNLLFGDDICDFIEEINSPHAYSILAPFKMINWQRFSATFKHIVERTIVLGRLSGNPEVTSIISDEYESIRLCMEHFAAMGRKKVALISAMPQSELETLRIAAWRKISMDMGNPLEWTQNHLLSLNLTTCSDEKSRIDSCFKRWVKNELKEADAVILPYGLARFKSVCQKAGISIPEDLAVVYIGTKNAWETQYPEIDFLDNNYLGHFQFALDIFEQRFKKPGSTAGSWYFCPPRGIISSRTAAAKKN
ncbi:MAG: GntR family transcriptional regulator [Lentisphaeria bacterium]|nr:GntR family transcriptional regulator [Lentisphaeria bacterium]